MVLKKRDRYKEQKGKVFAIIMKHCNKPVKNKIDGFEDYAKAEQDRDVKALLVKIKMVTHDANKKKYQPQQELHLLVLTMAVCTLFSRDLRG